MVNLFYTFTIIITLYLRFLSICAENFFQGRLSNSDLTTFSVSTTNTFGLIICSQAIGCSQLCQSSQPDSH